MNKLQQAAVHDIMNIKEKINIFYENQRNYPYEKDEKIVKDIKKSITSTDNNKEILTTIFY